MSPTLPPEPEKVAPTVSPTRVASAPAAKAGAGSIWLPRLAMLGAAIALLWGWTWFWQMRSDEAARREAELAASTGQSDALEKLTKLSPFAFTAQDGRTITNSDLAGKVWLANFIFSSCPGPCLALSDKMSTLNTVLPEDSRLRLVSFTIDPEIDSPAKLMQYGLKFRADPQRWLFLTSHPDPATRAYVVSDFLRPVSTTPESQKALAGRYLHSDEIALVDGTGTIRAYYDASQPGVNTWILNGVRSLLAEMDRQK